jgi:transposase
MSDQSKKKYSREYKLEVLELLRTSGKSKTQLERDLGLYPGQLRTWQRALAQEGEQAFPGTGHQTESDEEMRRLRHENEILRQERDILKKALAIFTPNPK